MKKTGFKRKLITLRRIIKTGGVNFFRNAWLGIAAMAVMIITLTIVLFSVIANATFTHTVAQITDRIDVSVYLKDNLKTEKLDQLINELKNHSNVRSVKYISKEQALENYKKQNADKPELLVAISQTENPLPASLQIKPKDPNRINDIKGIIDRKEIKELQSEETSYSGDKKAAIDNITSATVFFRKAGIVGVLAFAVISMLIIFNTIRMAIFNRRDEITIMRLLGASTNYIRGPFIVETIMYGVVAGVVSIVFLNGLFVISSSAFKASSLGLLDIDYANEYFAKHFWLFLTMQIGIGIFIGAASSFIATRRYLKFKTAK